MKKFHRFLFPLFLIFFLTWSTVRADEPPNPGGGPGGGDLPVGGGSPLGGGLAVLLALSAGYAMKRIYQLRLK